ncbi:MAG: type III-A CRISPR-associated protein Csm2 [Blastocatellia bacterium]
MTDTPQDKDEPKDKDKRRRRRKPRDRASDNAPEKEPEKSKDRGKDKAIDRGFKDRPHEKIKQRIEGLADLSSYGAKDLVRDARRLANYIGTLKTAQISRIYGAVKGLEMDFRRGAFDLDRLILLRPKLAYAANKNREVWPLQEVLDACIEKIRAGDEGRKDFERFVNFFEAILAYHREHRRS